MKHSHLYITANPLSDKSCFSSYVSKFSWPIRLQDYLKCNLKKEVRDQVDFLYVNRHQSFLLILFWHGWLGMPKVPKITSLRYLSD